MSTQVVPHHSLNLIIQRIQGTEYKGNKQNHTLEGHNHTLCAPWGLQKMGVPLLYVNCGTKWVTVSLTSIVLEIKDSF